MGRNLEEKGISEQEAMVLLENDFQTAALEMKDSAWYTQVGKRAQRLEEMMQNSADSPDTTAS